MAMTSTEKNSRWARPHIIQEKIVDPKRAVPNETSPRNEANMSTKRLYVSGVRDEHTERIFEDYFSKYGSVEKVEIINDKATGKYRGFVIISFDDYDAVDKCCLERQHMILNHRCNVEKSISEEEIAQMDRMASVQLLSVIFRNGRESVKPSSNPNPSKKQKTIELIAFDKNHVLQYEGTCKLQVNRLSSMLLIVPDNEDFKMKSAMFICDYFMDTKIIFVFGQHELSDFALIFDDEKRCKKVYDIIMKNKDLCSISFDTFEERFLTPFCARIAAANDGTNSELKRILGDWVQGHVEEAKEYYDQKLKEYNIYDLVY